MRKSLILTTLLPLIATLAVAGDVVKRGTALRDVPMTPLSSILETPKAFEGKPIVTEGRIARSCKAKGCWMELSAEKDGESMRVTFRDYGFFVPLDAAGADARVDGQVAVKKLSKAEADHLEDDGGKVVRSKDGSAIEISFVADGVELSKSK